MSNQSQKRKRNSQNPQDPQDNSSGTNNNTVYQNSLIRPTSSASASNASASSASVLRRALSLVPSKSAVPPHPFLTRPHNTGAASAANASAAKEPSVTIINKNPRSNLQSSLKRARTTAVAHRVTFPGLNNLSPPATPVNSQASTPEINFFNFPNLPNEKKGGRRTQKKKSRKQRRKQNRA